MKIASIVRQAGTKKANEKAASQERLSRHGEGPETTGQEATLVRRSGCGRLDTVSADERRLQGQPNEEATGRGWILFLGPDTQKQLLLVPNSTNNGRQGQGADRGLQHGAGDEEPDQGRGTFTPGRRGDRPVAAEGGPTAHDGAGGGDAGRQ